LGRGEKVIHGFEFKDFKIGENQFFNRVRILASFQKVEQIRFGRGEKGNQTKCTNQSLNKKKMGQ
jgi:hypothetical protein